MHWGTGTAAVQRNPRYVPATARSVSVTVNGGTPQYLNAPASTIVIDAPVGTDTFVFQTYDDQNGQGNVLSRASVTQTIVLGGANSVSAVLNGVVASVAISLSNPVAERRRAGDRQRERRGQRRRRQHDRRPGRLQRADPLGDQRLDEQRYAVALDQQPAEPGDDRDADVQRRDAQQRSARRPDRDRRRERHGDQHDVGGVHAEADVLPVLDPGRRQQAAVDRGRAPTATCGSPRSPATRSRGSRRRASSPSSPCRRRTRSRR